MAQGLSYVETTRQRRRLDYLSLFIIVPALLFGFRLAYLEIFQHSYYSLRAAEEHNRKYLLAATRGEIYLQDGSGTVPVALNQTLKILRADPKMITQKQKYAQELSALTGDSEADYYKLLNTNSQYVVLNPRVSSGVAAKITKLNLLGIGLDDQQYRVYPEGSLAAQVLGFVNSAGIGQYGVEGSFNSTLAGTPGLLNAKTDPTGVPIATADNILKQPINGDSVVLTIDRNVQAMAEKYLAQGVQAVQAAGGSVIIMDPNNGNIIADANYPTYNPNNYQNVTNYSVFENTAISDAFEPGSGFKVWTMSAGLDTNSVNINTTYNDTGEFTVDGTQIHNDDDTAYGVQTMEQVIEKSLNTGAMFVLRMLGGDPNNINMAGKQIWYNYVTKHFGFGSDTGIDIEGESPGYVPKPADTGANDVQYATMTFGQGLTVTMLQMVTAMTSIADGGKIYQPHIVSEVLGPNGNVVSKTKPNVLRSNVVSQNTIKQLDPMLELVTVHGSGYLIHDQIPNYVMAGKTGTAQIPLPGGGYNPTRNIGSFTGFGPVSDPKFVMMVRIDKPNPALSATPDAESTTVPVFINISKWLFQYYGVPPSS